MKLTSAKFKEGGIIPSRYTCLDLETGASKKEVEQAMKGHVLAEAQLMGLYEKGKGY